jgi:presequence protease
MSYNFDTVGKTYKGFSVTKYLPIPELNLTLIELVHITSGANVIHLANDDSENLFCLSFQTLPTSSNGVAHILEHLVLCGSDKYPVKDPFFSMTRRSLNTFMNAMTGSDFTCYPASSQVEKDFYNLLSVYLDAVFHPSLNKLSFLQEAHRLEFHNPNDATSPLEYKGVVFNEMKGALTSSDSRLWNDLMKNLLPDLPYCYNSGGNPQDIPFLTYEELQEFHKCYYHPSHCTFYFYGDISLEKHLDFIEKNALSGVDKKEMLPPIKKQSRFTSPVDVTTYYPIDQHEKTDDSYIYAFSFLTCSLSDQDTTLSLCLLDSILMDTDASPLRLALLQSGLCRHVEAYLDIEMSEVPWIIICKGCKKGIKDKLLSVIQKYLKAIASSEIPQDYIDAALHQLEFSRKEITGGSYPYGLNLFMRSVLSKQHGCDTENSLQIHSLFTTLSKKLENKDFLPSLINQYLLNNPHQVQISLEPDDELLAKENETERHNLEAIQNCLTTEGKDIIIKEAQALYDYQKKLAKQSLSCLPKITLKDVPKEIKHYSLKHEKHDNFDVYFHNAFTNNIIYADLTFNLPKLSEDELLLLSLFTSLLTQMGCGNRNYKDQLHYLHKNLGGISSYISLNTQYDNNNHCHPTLTIHGKSLLRNTDKLFDIIYDVVTSTNFSDIPRIKELLLQIYTHLEQGINHNAMRYAISLSQSSLSLPSYLNNHLYGLNFYHFIKDIVKDIDNKLPKLISKLTSLQTKVLPLKDADLILTCDEASYEKIKKENFYKLQKLTCKNYSKWQDITNFKEMSSQGKIIASPVAFTSLAYNCIGYTNKSSPSLLIASQLFENICLHENIREKGGAYGSGASFSPTTSNFYFYAYRDPNVSSTYNTFLEAMTLVAQGKFSDEELEEAKLGIIQDIDSPISPGSRGSASYHWQKSNKTKERREAFRESVITSTKEEIQQAVKDYLLAKAGEGIFVTFTNKELLEKEKKNLIKNNFSVFDILSL